jgi:hypothetical protein
LIESCEQLQRTLSLLSSKPKLASTMTVDPIVQQPDVYGQVHPVETPELIAAKLKEFDQLVATLPVTKKTRYIAAAQAKCPDLLTDDFKLLFLRCDVFDCAAAVNRYCSYWKKRVEIFGEHRAFQQLSVDNMLPDDRAALHQGVISVIERNSGPTALQPLQGGNRRSYCFLQPCKMDKTKYTSVSLVRAMWYNIHAAMLDDEHVQKQGLIFIDYAVGAKHSETDVVFTKLMIESFKGCMPVRFSAYHWCHPPSFVSTLWPLAAAFMGKRLRKRVRIHTGPPQKVLRTLETDFGFQKDELPTELGGTYQIDVPGWLGKRQAAGK